MRDIILERLKQDLMGPYERDEILESRPSDVYLTGILWPFETKVAEEEDESLGLYGKSEDGLGGSDSDTGISLAGQIRPCSAGVSFAARASQGHPEISIHVAFAVYVPVDPDPKDDQSDEETAKLPRSWQRIPVDIHLKNIHLTKEPEPIDLEPWGAPPDVSLHLRTAQWSGGRLATVTLLNQAQKNEGDGREELERLNLFQVSLKVTPEQGTLLVARPSRRAMVDKDDHVTGLLFRKKNEFATGHTCSADWETGKEPGIAEMVCTNWVPVVKVSATKADGHKVFDALRADTVDKPLSAAWLADAGINELKRGLLQIPKAYEKWLKARENELANIPREMREQAAENIENCHHILNRMTTGAERIALDATMAKAFRLANRAMDLQYSWDPEKSKRGPLKWRPFQLGFILLSAVSVVGRKHPDRGTMDLLWFPTGGGKTEAYLALIAFLAFYRRLASKGNPDLGDGVAAIMRYTLRLLTTQQFARAASVILACEAIRRGKVSGTGISNCDLGETPFSIGLWVGGESSPNKIQKAADALAGNEKLPSPNQLVNCPSCQTSLLWEHVAAQNSIQVRCENEQCLLFSEALPIWTVDEIVYRKRPTLLIGTIDKFTQIVRRKEVNRLFGLDRKNPPDLILQDELHLISGPLGTLGGLYEAAIDRMFSCGGSSPKIIGSTATIRRAEEQVSALFNRKTAQFPPSCLDANDSAFAVIDEQAPGRFYTGITTVGRSAKFTLQAVAASLLQSALAGTRDEDKDPYWTLVSYFNSLRELGGALVLMQDDVNDSLNLLAQRRDETVREPELIEELTSRRTQIEVRDMLKKLSEGVDSTAALDVLLATNMLSVGVDIPRLGLMLVNGQPKGVAEYIQATSRVGRGSVPGLVVTILNNGKPRDRSHYESFRTWHETLYRDVEPTGVTPFASRARDRALHAVLVALVRHLVPGMLDGPTLDDDSLKHAMNLIEDVARRVRSIDPEESAVKAELERFLGTWDRREPQNYWSNWTKNSLLQDAERAATLKALGRTPGEALPTLNNMRNVEAATRFRLAERLKEFDKGE